MSGGHRRQYYRLLGERSELISARFPLIGTCEDAKMSWSTNFVGGAPDWVLFAPVKWRDDSALLKSAPNNAAKRNATKQAKGMETNGKKDWKEALEPNSQSLLVFPLWLLLFTSLLIISDEVNPACRNTWQLQRPPDAPCIFFSCLLLSSVTMFSHILTRIQWIPCQHKQRLSHLKMGKTLTPWPKICI